jgi:hypothetical protein
MNNIIENIIKKQNEIILRMIAKDYNLDINILLIKYNTPTFYCV